MKNLFKALAEFQQECPIIHKGTEGYGYSYTSLSEIFKVINPLLKKYKLGFYQAVQGADLVTTIFHTESGECLESSAIIPQGVQLSKMNEFQVLGSAITYMRRYQLSAMLGIVTDKDIDSSGEQAGRSEQPKSNKKELIIGSANWQKVVTHAIKNKSLGLQGVIKKMEEVYDVTPAIKAELAKVIK